MMDSKQRTIATYDGSSQELAEYFRGIGSRVGDIEKALQLAGKPEDARVVEIGCGDGRDAQEIVKRVGWYQGFDPSSGLLDLARKDLPDTDFVLADAESYEFPDNLDVIFAFASLLHVPKDELPAIFNSAHNALKSGGIFYISLKERDEYTEEIKKDQYGERTFYFYSPQLIEELAGEGYESVAVDHQQMGNTKWFTIALRRRV